MMDANGEGLSFIGKEISLLYVDNQRVDVAVLSSISVDDIKWVEIIRNPSVYTLVYDDDRNISKFTFVNYDKESGVSLGVDVPLH